MGFPDSSVGKVSAFNAGDLSSFPGYRLPIPVFLGFPCGSAGRESSCNAGDLSLIPEFGRSPGEEKGYPIQYSGLENSMDYAFLGVAKNWTGLNDFQFHFHFLEYL